MELLVVLSWFWPHQGSSTELCLVWFPFSGEFAGSSCWHLFKLGLLLCALVEKN